LGNGKLALHVEHLTESRREYAFEKQSLWMCTLPLISVGAYWKQPDWLLWNKPYYAGYKHAGQDLAEVFAQQARRSGMFGTVTSGAPGDARHPEPNFVLSGDVENLTLTWCPHFLGLSMWLGEPLGRLGVPMGQWKVEQSLRLQLTDPTGERVYWQHSFTTRAAGVIAAYYGSDPMRCGYPPEKLLDPVVAELLEQLEQRIGRELARQNAALDQ